MQQVVAALSAAERHVLSELSGLPDGVINGSPGVAAGVLRDVRAWRELLEDLNLTEAVTAADELLVELRTERVRSWSSENLDRPLPVDADALFRRLLRTTVLQISLPQAEPEAARTVAEEERAQSFRDVRDRLRQEFERVNKLVPPTAAQRSHWVSSLVDRADATLTAIDEAPPEAAAWQLELVMDDLDWHRRHVETQSGSGRRQLGRKFRRLRAERQERDLQFKLEEKFGPKRVAQFERTIFWLIFLVLGLIILEFSVTLPPATILTLHLVDALICAVFLWEFFFKLALVKGKWLWFRRHVLIDLLPSIPFGLLTMGANPADTIRAGRAARLVRVSRLVRYVRILRPFVRLVRAFGFLIRGLDRLARSYGRVLNRNVILFPTREERQRGREEQESPMWRMRDARIEVETRWRETLTQAASEDRPRIAFARLDVFRNALSHELEQTSAHASATADDQKAPHAEEAEQPPIREIPAELALRRLASTTPQEVRMVLGDDLTRRVARMVRTFAWPPLCWLPIISAFAPRISRRMADEEVVAAAAHSASKRFGKYYARYLWLSDLYGTVTPSEFLDRLGGMLVKASFRPTYRLALFGGLFLLTQQLISLIPFMSKVHEALSRIVGTPLIILGGVCVFILGVGWWLKRLAREATEFYERAVDAQFLALTEDFRSRHLHRDSEVIHQRVLQPEWNLIAGRPTTPGERSAQIEDFRHRVHMALIGHLPEAAAARSFDLLERTAMIYRDSLDGAMFTDSDTRATGQLLGNPSVQQALRLSARVSKRDRKALRVLDLERQKALFGGPYLWFNFIARSMAHSAACLIVDYNRNAIPLAEIDVASAAERARYDAWLSAKSELFNAADESADWEYSTTAFTALHFLDDVPERDADVARRFGVDVRDKMRRDRSLLFRRVFGTYPLHRRQKENRLLNIYVLYDKWLGGGKAIFLPLVFFFRGCTTVWRFLRWVGKAIKEVRGRNRRARYDDAADADFATAVRKIDRMRGPITRATMTLRAKFDPAYLGIALPGEAASTTATPQFEEDLRYLDAEPEFVRELRDAQRRAVRDLRRLDHLLETDTDDDFSAGLLARLEEIAGVPAGSYQTDEHHRAAAIIYTADYDEIRTLISGGDVLERIAVAAPAMHLPPARSWFGWRRKPLLNRWWKKYQARQKPGDAARNPVAAEHEQAAPAHPELSAREQALETKEAVWRAIHANLDGAGLALLAWGKYGERAQEEGLRRLADILRHPNRISEHLVTLRTIQTLSMLDIVHYRSHVYRLGEFEKTEIEGGDLLSWHVCQLPQTAAPPSLMEAGEEVHEVME